MATKHWWVLVLLPLMVTCRPSRESKTAGLIGCPPSEIVIQDEDSSVGFSQRSETWVAECRGKRFICNEIDTASESFVPNEHTTMTDSDVHCSPELGSAGDAAPAAATPSPKAASSEQPKPPLGAAGFEFGSSLESTSGACQGAGHSWTPAGKGSYRCSGPADDLGFPAEVLVNFCRGALCGITVEYRPESRWAARFMSLKATLEKKYGSPSRTAVGSIPQDCRADDQLVACLDDDVFSLKVVWSWKAGRERINLRMGKPEDGDGAAAIRIQYLKPPPAVSTNSSAL